MKIRELISDLRELEDKRRALENIPDKIATLEIGFASIRAASSDGEAVPGGGGNRREEAMINNIAMREKLRRDLEITRRDVARMDAALAVLNADERLVIERLFLHRSSDSVDRLCVELCFSRAQVYRLKDYALNHLARVLYGIVEL